jgi:hypothetical protein
VLDLEKHNEMFTTYKLLGLGREQTTKGHIQAWRKTYRKKQHALPYPSAKTTDFKPNNLVIQRNNTPPLLPTQTPQSKFWWSNDLPQKFGLNNNHYSPPLLATKKLV